MSAGELPRESGPGWGWASRLVGRGVQVSDPPLSESATSAARMLVQDALVRAALEVTGALEQDLR